MIVVRFMRPGGRRQSETVWVQIKTESIMREVLSDLDAYLFDYLLYSRSRLFTKFNKQQQQQQQGNVTSWSLAVTNGCTFRLRKLNETSS